VSTRTTSGITSPARWITTRSPLRTSSLRTSSRLWSVARFTVVPPTRTGASAATGVSVPMRPTYTRMSSIVVVACSAGNLHAVGPHREVPLRRGLRVELTHGAGGRVARVGEGRLAALGALLVRRRERRAREVDLAPDVKPARHRLPQRERYGADRPQIPSDVL